MKLVLLATLALLASTPSLAQTAAGAAPESIAVGEQRDTIDTGEDQDQRLTVPVMVNGQGPFNFIIDTGADRSVVSRELADKLALPQSGKATLHSMGGVNEIKTVKIDRLQVGSNVIRDVKAPALLRRNLGADGLLGLDALKNQRIVLDFTAQTMTVEQANTKAVREERDAAGTIIVTAKSRLGQLVLVDADANGQDVWVVVDTGGQNTVGNSALRRLMVKRTPAGGFKPVQLVSVVGDRIDADYTIVGRMRIGGIQLSNAAVAFVDAHPFKRFGMLRKPSMLMGMDGLRMFRRVSIDFANRNVKFLMPTGAELVGAGK
jgi:predicted aspartyl protease